MENQNKIIGRESDKFMLRLPDGMRDKIAEVAKVNGRSMNAEIIARLQNSFGGASKAAIPPPELLGGKIDQLLEENINMRLLLDKQLALMSQISGEKLVKIVDGNIEYPPKAVAKRITRKPK